MLLSYDLITFQILGQKSVKFLGGFLENLKFQKGHSAINLPLATKRDQNWDVVCKKLFIAHLVQQIVLQLGTFFIYI